MLTIDRVIEIVVGFIEIGVGSVEIGVGSVEVGVGGVGDGVTRRRPFGQPRLNVGKEPAASSEPTTVGRELEAFWKITSLFEAA